MHKERINYIISEEGKYTGYSVNLPMIVGQADSLEELEESMKEMAAVVLEHFQETFNQVEPFELKEVTRAEWFKNGQADFLTIKEQKEIYFRAIKNAEEALKELRSKCRHTNTSEVLYSWRIGSAEPATVCDDCGELIRYIHQFEIETKSE